MPLAMRAPWTLDDIKWDEFDPAKVDPETLKSVKAAALVEYNSADYVTYLRTVFGDDPEMMEEIEIWGIEERQHGAALGRWAEIADPSFNLEDAFARFQEGYHINEGAEGSVRGSRAGEMIARCVVESGTSSYYSGMRDNTAEPVLRQIAANIAADEFRHYRLFLEGFEKYQPRENVGFWRRFYIALTRVQEAEDDELAYAYYCGNVQKAEESQHPYKRDFYSKEYNRQVMRFYHWPHVKKAVAMICKAAGLKPTGAISKNMARVLWWVLKARGSGSAVQEGSNAARAQAA